MGKTEKSAAKKPGKKAIRRLLMLAGASILSCLCYFGALSVFGPEAQFVPVIVFLLLSCGLAVFYFIYNRGLVVAGATPDMLPDTMSYEEKTAAIEAAVERKKKTAWIAAAVFALILPVLLDAFYLFVLEDALPEGFLSWLK